MQKNAWKRIRNSPCNSNLRGSVMTKKHFIMLASLVKEAKEKASEGAPSVTLVHYVACKLADECKKENPRFDRDRFLEACGYTIIK